MGYNPIPAGALTAAQMSAPKFVFPIIWALDRIPANQASLSQLWAYVPFDGSTLKVTVSCRNAVNGKTNAWPRNAAGSLVCASNGLAVAGATCGSAALAVNNVTAGTRIGLWTKSSTTTSALGLTVTLWCKGNLGT